MNMSNNQKLVAAVVVIAVVIALFALGKIQHKEAVMDSQSVSTTTGVSSVESNASATTTSVSTNPSMVKPSAAPAPKPKPVALVVPLGKTIVDHASGIGLTLTDVDSNTNSTGRTSVVAFISVNTNVCTPGQGCAARSDTKQNLQASAPYGFTYGEYFVKLDSVTAESAHFTITKS